MNIKKIISFCAIIIIGYSANAQIYQNDPAFGKINNRIDVLYSFRIPNQDTTAMQTTRDSVGQIVRRPQDGALYMRGISNWSRVGQLPGSAVLDSASWSHDTLFFRQTIGGELAIKITGLPQVNINGLPDSLQANNLQRVMERGNISNRELLLDAGTGAGRLRFRTNPSDLNIIYSQSTGAASFRPLEIATGGLLVSGRDGSIFDDDGINALHVQGSGYFQDVVTGVPATAYNHLTTRQQVSDTVISSIAKNAVLNGLSPQQNTNFNITGNGNISNVFSAGTYTGKLFATTDTIFWYGDSYTFGVGASPSTLRFSTLSTTNLGGFERNYGIGSSTMTPGHWLGARDLLDTLPKSLANKSVKGRLLVFQLGLNDVGCNAGAVDTVAYKAAYRTALNFAKVRNWDMRYVVLLSPAWIPDSGYRKYATLNFGNGTPTRTRHVQFVDATRAIAAEYSTGYINLYDSIRLNGGATLMSNDSLHPNNTGHAFIAKLINNYSRSIIPSDVNSALYADSTGAKASKLLVGTTTNDGSTNVLQANGTIRASGINNAASNFIINNTVAAFTQELAVIPPSFAYGQPNYYGFHFDLHSNTNLMESVGVGTQRARAFEIGFSNNPLIFAQQHRVMKIDSTGEVTIDSLTNSLVIGTDANGKLIPKSSTTLGANFILNNPASAQTATIKINGDLINTATATYTTGGYSPIVVNSTTGRIEKSDLALSAVMNQTASDQTGGLRMSGIGYLGGGLGIGTTTLSPVGGFTNIAMDGVTGSFIDLRSSGTGKARFVSTANNTYLGTLDNTPVAIRTNNIVRMTVDSTTGYMGINTITPASTLQVNGSVAGSTRTITANRTLDATDFTIIANNSGAITITLPTAASCTGRIYAVKKISAALNNVSIQPAGAELLDGTNVAKLITIQYSAVMIQSNGTSWYMISSAVGGATL